MVDRSRRLSRAVPCSWEGCRNTTRDTSMLCFHHRRASLVSAAAVQRAAQVGTFVPRLRLPETQRLLAQPGENIAHAAYALGQEQLARYPELVLEWPRLRVRNAFTLDSTIAWLQSAKYLAPATSRQEGQVVLSREGDDLVIHPEESLESTRVLVEALRTQRVRWYDMCAESGILGGAGEGYDDRAEILSQLRLLNEPNSRLSYSVRGDGVVGVHIHPVGGFGMEEHYYLEGRPGLIGLGSNGEVHVGMETYVAADSHTVTRREDRWVSLPLADRPVPEREEFLRTVCSALTLVNKYAIDVDGQVYLPVGWTEQDA